MHKWEIAASLVLKPEIVHNVNWRLTEWIFLEGKVATVKHFL